MSLILTHAGKLAGGLAHDFNNLLTSISGSMELLQTRLAQGRLTNLDRYINVAQGTSKRAAALTHRLLAFSRRQTLDSKPTDVNRLVAGMEELIRRTVGPEIAIEVVGAAGLWPTLVDPAQLENALLTCASTRAKRCRAGAASPLRQRTGGWTTAPLASATCPLASTCSCACRIQERACRPRSAPRRSIGSSPVWL